MSSVLFVDDEQHVIDGLKRMLRGQGFPHECIGVTSAQEALELLSTREFDVVVSDVRMPGMDGVELLARIKGTSDVQFVPVIMLTGYSDADAKRTAIHLGAYDFISKPADPSELVARLENALRMKRYEDTLRDQNAIMERQLLQAQKMEVVGLLASGLVHDLNNILGSIVGYTELASMSAKDNPDIQTHLTHAAESGQHATKLVRQILNLGRATDPGRLLCNLADEVDDSIRLISAAAPANVEFVWSKPAGTMTLEIDSTQVHQILMNLCTNAIHAMDRQGTITVTLDDVVLDPRSVAELGLGRPGHYAKISVADTGPGMDAATVDQVFDPFFTTKAKGSGTGIGLSVVQRIIENHDGLINVSSTPGQGATFTLYLPLAANDTAEARSVKLGEHHAEQKADSVC